MKKLKKVKKISLSKAKKKAWDAFSLYIRTRGSVDGMNECITCGRTYEIKQGQAGHWLPNRKNSVLFDERNCHFQCYGCNVMKKSNPIKYYHFMEFQYGLDVMSELEELDEQTVQYKVFDYQEIEIKFKAKLAELK